MKRTLVVQATHRANQVAQAVVSLARKAKQNPLLVVLLTIIICLLGIIGVICVAALGPFVTRPGAIVVDFVVLWLILRVLVRALVFPGSVVCWKRSTEQSFKTEIARQFCHHLIFLHSFLQQIVGGEPEKAWTLEKAGKGANVLDTLIRNFNMQLQDEVSLNEQQQELSQLASNVAEALKNAKIQFAKDPNTTTSMHAYLLAKIGGGQASDMLGLSSHDGGHAFWRLKDHIVIDGAEETKRHLATLIERLKELHTKFKGNCIRRAQNFLAVPTIGSLHAIRAELSIRFKGQQMWIRGKKSTLDAMFIPARSDATLATSPVVVCCNPNAGYYETTVYQSDWIEFYLTRGVSVMVFNYSGYGRSRGIPSPNAVREDADLIVSHLFSLGCKHVGIHGRSIGGVAACYAASKHPLAFCVADRTFASLGLTAKYTYGRWAEQGLRVCGTSCENTSYFYSIPSTCTKIVMVDPNDAIIPDFASLRTGLALTHVDSGPADALSFTDEALSRLISAYTYLQRLFNICDPDPAERELRTVVFANYDPLDERRPSLADAETGPTGWDDLKWLDRHEEAVRLQFPVELLGHLRQASDSFLHGINASGSSLDDALSQDHNAGTPLLTLKCFIANLQVWGSLPAEGDPIFDWKSSGGASYIEILKYVGGTDSVPRLRETEKRLKPDDISDFYRFCAKVQVTAQRKEFRRHALRVSRVTQPEQLTTLVRLAQDAITEFDTFLANIARYFKRTDGGIEVTSQVSTSDSSDDGDRLACATTDVLAFSAESREKLGYQIHLDCGHNGQPDSHESRQLAFLLNPVIARMLENTSQVPVAL